MKRTKLIYSAIAASIGLAASAVSATPLWEFTTAGNSFSNGSWDFATAFTANTNLMVSGLGYYADPTNGQVDANQVALYKCADATCSTTGTLIASATVTNIYALLGHFRYVTIAPVLLEAGVSYEVAGVSHGDNYTWNDPGFATDPGITLISLNGTETDRWQSGATPDFLNVGQGGGASYIPGQDGFWGPNVFIGEATFTGTTPEPASLALVGLALAGLGSLRRRQRK